MLSLVQYKEYNRQEVHDILSPESTVKCNAPIRCWAKLENKYNVRFKKDDGLRSYCRH